MQITLFPVSLDGAVGAENEARLIDCFVNSLDLGEFGFRVEHTENGRPAYHPVDMLKLYIYGYLNRVRSSRQLEKECARNIEVKWLLKSLKPDKKLQRHLATPRSNVNMALLSFLE